VAALTSQNHMTKYFHKAKEHRRQWQLSRNYCLTCTPGCELLSLIKII